MLGEKEERTREDEKESILLQKEEEGLFTAETVIEVDAPQEV